MGRLPNRLPAVRAVWLHNEVPARRILAVAWLERGASVPRAANLPCAYTDLATCPLPPAGNRVPVAVEAGEKIPTSAGDLKLEKTMLQAQDEHCGC